MSSEVLSLELIEQLVIAPPRLHEVEVGMTQRGEDRTTGCLFKGLFVHDGSEGMSVSKS